MTTTTAKDKQEQRKLRQAVEAARSDESVALDALRQARTWAQSRRGKRDESEAAEEAHQAQLEYDRATEATARLLSTTPAR